MKDRKCMSSKTHECLEVRVWKIFIFLADDHFREMLVMFSAEDVTGYAFLHADPFITRCCNTNARATRRETLLLASSRV
jgi:hypothetical protein